MHLCIRLRKNNSFLNIFSLCSKPVFRCTHCACVRAMCFYVRARCARGYVSRLRARNALRARIYAGDFVVFLGLTSSVFNGSRLVGKPSLSTVILLTLAMYCTSSMLTMYCISTLARYCLSSMLARYCLSNTLARYCISSTLAMYCISKYVGNVLYK